MVSKHKINMKIRELRIGKLKPGCDNEYKNAHDNIWPELEEEYKQNGVIEISCFLNKTDLYVYMEYEEDTWGKVDKSKLKWDSKWQEYMKTLCLPVPDETQPIEIYRLK